MAAWTGRCLCGQIGYRIATDDPPLGVTVCHCRQCARWTGSHGAFVPVRLSDLTVTGDPRWFQSSPEVRRGSCPSCGSALFWQAEPGNRIYVTAGSLDPPVGLAVVEHLHTLSKSDWYALTDSAPKKPEE